MMAYLIVFLLDAALAAGLSLFMHGAANFSLENYLFYIIPLVVISELGVRINLKRGKSPVSAALIGILLGLIVIALFIAASILLLHFAPV
jgi:hypothetical protein